MGATLALLALYALCGAAIALAARFLKRPIPARVLGLLSLLPLLLFPESFFGDKTPLPLDHALSVAPWREASAAAPRNPDLNDVALQFLPWAKASRLAWKAGEPPMRNRWSGAGSPLAANGQSGAFSPFLLLGLLLPLARAFTLAAGCKVLLAAAGTWLLARELELSLPASLFAAVSFALSLGMTAWILFPHSAVLCLWPWLLFSIELLRTRDLAGRAFAALTLCLACMFLAGHPETLVLGVLFAALWLVGRRVSGSLPGGFTILGRTALAGLLAAGLTAWLLFPELNAIAASNRLATSRAAPLARFLSWTPHAPLSLAGLVTTAFPRALGSSVGPPMLPIAPAAFPELAIGCTGTISILLALMIVRPGSPRRRDEMVLLGLGGLGIAIGIGLWPLLEILARAPGIADVSPLRFLAWAAMALPLVAAFELDRWMRDVGSRPRARLAPIVAALCLCAAAVAVFLRLEPLYRASGGLDVQRLLLGSTCAIALAASGGAAILWRRPRRFAALACVLAAAELLVGARSLYRASPGGWLYPESPLLRFARDQPGTFRVLGEGAVLYPDTAVFAGLEDVRTHDPVERRDYVDFLNAACGYDPLDYFKIVRDVNAPALDFLNVRFLLAGAGRASPGPKWRLVYSDPRGTIFRSDSALPRVFAPEAVRFVRPAPGDSHNSVERFGEAFGEIAGARDFRRVAYLLASDEAGVLENGPVEVSDYAETAGAASFRTRAPSGRRAFVVASLTQDGGWSARDASGRALRVFEANGPFLAVEVPGGSHGIRLRYSAPGSGPGLGVAIAALAAGGIAAIVRRRRRGATAA